MPNIHEELIIFLNAAVTGVIVRLFYQLIKRLRECVKHPDWVVGVEDFLFWTFMAIYTFVQIYQTSSGVIRWYFALGVVVGAIFISKVLKKIEEKGKKIRDLHKGKIVAK